MPRSSKAAIGLGALFSVIIVSFLLSTAIFVSPRLEPATQYREELLFSLPTLRQNLHGAPEVKPQPAAFDRTRSIKNDSASTQFSLDSGSKGERKLNSTDFNLGLFNLQKGAPFSLVGRVNPPMQPMDISKMIAMFSFMNDGHFVPELNSPLEKIAILIPYRNRRKHLFTLLPVLIPLLMRQNVQFGIFVIELDAPTTFNKGALFNAGFLEIMKRDNYDCIILHDVDLIPLDDRNLYRCDKDHPIHFSANIVDYAFFYNGLFGGVVGFTPHQFKAINGASNVYFGWGGEDDDLRDRALGRNFTIIRKPSEFAIYKMVSHTKRGYWKANPNRFRIFASRRDRWDYDGLNSLEYKVTRVINKRVVAWINIAVNATRIVQTLPEDLRVSNEEDFVIDVQQGIINL